LVKFVIFLLKHVDKLYDLASEVRQFDEFTPLLLCL
jgi:hypothetical protein